MEPVTGESTEGSRIGAGAGGRASGQRGRDQARQGQHGQWSRAFAIAGRWAHSPRRYDALDLAPQPPGFPAIGRNPGAPAVVACIRSISAFGSRDIERIAGANCDTSLAAAHAHSHSEGYNRPDIYRHIHRRRHNRSGPVVGSCKLANLESGSHGIWCTVGTKHRTLPLRRRTPRRA